MKEASDAGLVRKNRSSARTDGDAPRRAGRLGTFVAVQPMFAPSPLHLQGHVSVAFYAGLGCGANFGLWNAGGSGGVSV